MACRHFGVLTLAVACLLLVSSLSTDEDPDEEHNSDEHSEKGVYESIIEKRSIKKPKKKDNQKKNKNKPKKKNNKNKRPKVKKPKNEKPATKSKVSCGFNDDELAMNGTKRNPWDTWRGYIWANGRIPYYFKGTVSYRDKALIRRAMAQIRAKTCFRFVEVYSQPSNHHLEITVGSATCGNGFSGYVTGEDYPKMKLVSEYRLTDRRRCNHEGGILHELMHALGVGHTQKRTDRGEFITVKDDNIMERYFDYDSQEWIDPKDQYEPCQGCTIHPSVPYDCESIMHYGYETFRKDGRGPTMTAKNSNCCKLTSQGTSVATDTDWKLLKIIADKVCTASCTGTSNDWHCCSSSKPCQELQGDCDTDSDCAGSLICGHNNCKKFFDKAEDLADCCIKPEVTPFHTYNIWNMCVNLGIQCPSGQVISWQCRNSRSSRSRSRCPQTEECMNAGGTCQKENEEKEQGQDKVKGKANTKGKGKGKGKQNGKGKKKQQEHGENLCKLGCKCMTNN